MRWYRELCTDLLAFTLQLRKPRKTSVRRQLMKSVRPVIASNGLPYSKWRSHSIRKGEGRKEDNRAVLLLHSIQGDSIQILFCRITSCLLKSFLRILKWESLCLIQLRLLLHVMSPFSNKLLILCFPPNWSEEQRSFLKCFRK